MKLRLRIKELRKERGMTREQLGKKLCYSEHTVKKWERGIAYPTIDTLVVLADLFGCTLDDLVEREGTPQ